ncbi:MAG: preprotein translocase subunit SecY [Christensenellales bacterium]
MFEILRNAWKIPELKKKILYTLMMLLVFRLGSIIPIAGIDTAYVAQKVADYSILGFLNMLSGGALESFTIFAMGITPYINASIIMNLLQVAIPALERMSKEGEEGQKKISRITRYVAIGIAFVQGIGILLGLGSDAVISPSIWNYVLIGICLAAGTAFVMWIGDCITDKGVGNGVSLLIFTGIVSRLPITLYGMAANSFTAPGYWWKGLLVVLMSLITIVGVVFVELGERRVPVQYAKRVVGRKMYGGQSSHIPMKVNSSGVMPIIFAMTLLSLPGMIAQFVPTSGFSIWYESAMGAGKPLYYILFALLILFFAYFYTSISFNPTEMAKNIQQNGGFLPGVRPGKPTSDYLNRISKRLTLFGAIFLAILATGPSIVTTNLAVTSMFGATSVLIMVSVALETSKQLESQMLMRHYKGFLK